MASADVDMVDVTADENSVPLSLAILDTVKTAQLQNGLRHCDYQRYRQYCTRRLRRVRKSIKFTHGKGRQYIKKKVTPENCAETRNLYIPLYNAERAWSYAMQLREDEKNDKEAKGDDMNSRIKFHLVSRLAKAAFWSKELLQICLARTDARTALEAEAYAAYMSGNLQLYRENWKVARDNFATASRIYTELSKVGTLEEQDVFQQQLDEIHPYMRYCEYNLASMGRKSDYSRESAALMELQDGGSSLLQGKLESVIAEARKKQAETMMEIKWRGKSIPVQSEEIRVALLTPQEHVSKLSADANDSKNDAIYLAIFSAYDDAIRIIRHEQEKYEKMKSGQKVEAQREELQLLEAYARYKKLNKLLERNLILMHQLKSKLDNGDFDKSKNLENNANQRQLEPVDMIHIFDMLLQNIADLQILPGSQDDITENVVNSARAAAFKAFRSYYVAETYAADNKFAEASILYERAADFASAAEEHYEEWENINTEELKHVQKLQEQISGAKCRTQALSFMKSAKIQDDVTASMKKLAVASLKAKENDKTLLERLDSFDAGDANKGQRLVDIPPTMVPIPAKPLLFDIAHNEVVFPDISERMKTEEKRKKEAEAKATETSKGSGGFFGWFRG